MQARLWLIYTVVFNCRQQKDAPVLMDSQIEEMQQMQRFERIQTYRLVRDNVLEHKRQDELNMKEFMRRQLDMYDDMQVCGDRKKTFEHL